MSKKEDNKEFELAKDLFLKSYKPQLFLNDQSVKQYEADIKNSLKVAELFIKLYENQTSNNRGE